MHLCLPRKVHLIRSRRRRTGTRRGVGEKERETGRGMKGCRYRTRGFTRSRESKFMRRAGTDISQKMNHPYTSGPTHRGNSGTIVRQQQKREWLVASEKGWIQDKEGGEGEGRGGGSERRGGSRDARTTKVGHFVGRFSLRSTRVDR